MFQDDKTTKVDTPKKEIKKGNDQLKILYRKMLPKKQREN